MRFGLLIALLGVGLALNGLVFAGEHGKGKGKGKDKDNQEVVDTDQGGGKGQGKGQGKAGGDRPHGWDQGKKQGWDSEYPPGWDKKSDEEKNKWKKDLEDTKDEVGKAADAKGVTAEERSRFREAVERMCRRGRDFKQASGEVIEQMKKGKDAIQIMRENGIVIEAGGQ